MSEPFKVCCGDAEFSFESESVVVGCPHGIARIGLPVPKDDALRAQLERVRELSGRLARRILYQHSVAGMGHAQTAKCDTCDLCRDLEAALKKPVREEAGKGAATWN